MPATSFLPLLTRIKEVLVDGAGASYALAEPHRFLEGYPGQPADQASRDSQERKRYWARISGMTRYDGTELATVLHYPITVQIATSYFVEHPSERSEWRAVIAAAALDGHLVRSAISWPGNLVQTAAAKDTGLADGSIEFVSYAIEDPDPNARLLRASFQFTGLISLSRA